MADKVGDSTYSAPDPQEQDSLDAQSLQKETADENHKQYTVHVSAERESVSSHSSNPEVQGGEFESQHDSSTNEDCEPAAPDSPDGRVEPHQEPFKVHPYDLC